MPIQGNIGGDAQIAQIISDSQRQINSQNSDQQVADQNADASLKSAEKHAQEKKADLNTQQKGTESFQKDDPGQKGWNDVIKGVAGNEAQNAALGLQNNPAIQSNLTPMLREMFAKQVMANPQNGATAANALVSMAQSPAFSKAVTSPSTLAEVMQPVLGDPIRNAPMMQKLLNMDVMQSSKTPTALKNDFMRFGVAQGAKGDLPLAERAGDMLSSVGRNATGDAMAASMRMASRVAGRGTDNTRPDATGAPDAETAIDNVDTFVQHPAVQQMPRSVRGQATEMLAKSDGDSSVKEGFERLASDKTFRGLSNLNQQGGDSTADLRGRIFSTIGSGRPSDVRALTDTMLTALQTNGFPTREVNVSKFLSKLNAQVQSGGAKGANVKSALKGARGASGPAMPTMQSTRDMDDEDAAQVRALNRAKVMQYFNQVNRNFDDVEKSLSKAHYQEDVNSMANLRDPVGVDASELGSEDKAFIDGKLAQAKTRYAGLKKTQQQKMRELRGKRMPPQKRLEMQAARRKQVTQPKYFKPNAAAGARTLPGQARGGAMSAKAAQMASQQPQMPTTPGMPSLRAQVRQDAPKTAAQRQRGVGRSASQAAMSASGTSVETDDDVLAETLAQLAQDPTLSDAQKQQQAVRLISQQAAQKAAQQAQQQTEQFLNQLMPGSGGATMPASGSTPRQTARPTAKPASTDRTDGWGIPRATSSDLGGTRLPAVKPAATAMANVSQASSADTGPSREQVVNERYTGRTLVKDSTQIRDLQTMYSLPWKSMSKAESALWRNLGWNQNMWDTKNEAAAQWPTAMRTAFQSLSPTQRQAVRQLGLSADEWDLNVESFGSPSTDEERVGAGSGSAGA